MARVDRLNNVTPNTPQLFYAETPDGHHRTFHKMSAAERYQAEHFGTTIHRGAITWEPHHPNRTRRSTNG